MTRIFLDAVPNDARTGICVRTSVISSRTGDEVERSLFAVPGDAAAAAAVITAEHKGLRWLRGLFARSPRTTPEALVGAIELIMPPTSGHADADAYDAYLGLSSAERDALMETLHPSLMFSSIVTRHLARRAAEEAAAVAEVEKALDALEA